MSFTEYFGGGGKLTLAYVEPGTLTFTLAGTTPVFTFAAQTVVSVSGTDVAVMAEFTRGAAVGDWQLRSANTGRDLAVYDNTTGTDAVRLTFGASAATFSYLFGYATGAGGAVTQITSRSTGVTLSKVTGTITTDTTSLAAEAAATFTVTNTTVAIGDTVVVSQQSGSNGGNTNVYVSTVAAGSFNITVANNNAAAGTAETGAILINFAVVKAVSA